MFLEMAIGDAYGAGFEYAPADFRQAKQHSDRIRQTPQTLACTGQLYRRHADVDCERGR